MHSSTYPPTYLYTYVRTYIHTDRHTNKHTHTHPHTHTHAYMYVCMDAYPFCIARLCRSNTTEYTQDKTRQFFNDHTQIQRTRPPCPAPRPPPPRPALRKVCVSLPQPHTQISMRQSPSLSIQCLFSSRLGLHGEWLDDPRHRFFFD